MLILSVVGRYASGQVKCCSHDALCQFQRQSYDSDESLKGQYTKFHLKQLELTIYMLSSLEVIYPSSDPFYYCCQCHLSFQLFGVLFSQDSSKNIQIEAFHVFKVSSTAITFLLIHRSLLSLIIVYYASQLFAANKNKPAEVVNILVTNRSKLLRFFAGFKIDKGTIPAPACLCTCLLM